MRSQPETDGSIGMKKLPFDDEREKLGFEKIKDCEESDDTQRYADVSVVLDSAKVALCKTFRGQVYI